MQPTKLTQFKELNLNCGFTQNTKNVYKYVKYEENSLKYTKILNQNPLYYQNQILIIHIGKI